MDDSIASYGNAVPGCFHAGAGAGPACMNDLVATSYALHDGLEIATRYSHDVSSASET